MNQPSQAAKLAAVQRRLRMPSAQRMQQKEKLNSVASTCGIKISLSKG